MVKHVGWKSKQRVSMIMHVYKDMPEQYTEDTQAIYHVHYSTTVIESECQTSSTMSPFKIWNFKRSMQTLQITSL